MISKLLLVFAVAALPASVMASETPATPSGPDGARRSTAIEAPIANATLAALLQAHAAATSGLSPFALAPVGRDRDVAPPRRDAAPQTN